MIDIDRKECKNAQRREQRLKEICRKAPPALLVEALVFSADRADAKKKSRALKDEEPAAAVPGATDLDFVENKNNDKDDNSGASVNGGAAEDLDGDLDVVGIDSHTAAASSSRRDDGELHVIANEGVQT